MSTLKITIKDSKFVSSNGVNVELFSRSYIEGNEWKAWISEKGDVDCVSICYYRGVRHQIKLKIKNAFVKVILKVGDEYPKVLKTYQLEKWPVDGVIGLPNGFIHKRKPYFREAAFQEFLDEYKITAVRYETPNSIFPTKQEICRETSIFEEKIETDGKSEIIFQDVEVLDGEEGQSYIVHREIETTNATWVIKKVTKLGKMTHKILYTTDNPQNIIGLPKL